MNRADEFQPDIEFRWAARLYADILFAELVESRVVNRESITTGGQLNCVVTVIIGRDFNLKSFTLDQDLDVWYYSSILVYDPSGELSCHVIY